MSTENNSEEEETFTYQVIVGVAIMHAPGEEDTISLGDYEISDQKWDSMSPAEKRIFLSDAEEDFVRGNVRSWARVEK